MVASLIGGYPAKVIFTSGATEINNLAILGTTRALKSQTKRRQLVTTRFEHKVVLESLHVLQAIGMSREDAYSTVRVGIGRSTTRADVDRAVSLIEGALESLQV